MLTNFENYLPTDVATSDIFLINYN